MGVFRHQTDGSVYLDEFAMTLEEFLEQEPAYASHAGESAMRLYSQGAFHYLFDRVMKRTSGPMPWEPGDNYLSRAAQIRRAVEARRAATGRVPVRTYLLPAPPPPTERGLADVLAAFDLMPVVEKEKIEGEAIRWLVGLYLLARPSPLPPACSPSPSSALSGPSGLSGT